MPIEIKVPSVGESVTSGVLGAWKKKDGEYVRQGDAIFEFETDKVTSEVFADANGALKHLVAEGTQIDVGQIVAQIDESATAPAGEPAKPVSTAPQPSPTPAKPATTEPQPLSPAVRRMVEENAVDPAKVTGTGKGGRLIKSDILDHLATAPAPKPVSQLPRTTRKKMTQLRRKIADRLVSAQHTAAILTTFNEVDMSHVMALRAKFQDRFVSAHGVKLGFMSFFVKAVVGALKRVPAINARIEGDEIISHNFYDIGVAIGTEKGLIVPVLRDADAMSLADVEKAIIEYAQKARSGKITMPDLEGGVFTISNGGVYGSMLSTPILNPPQSGILGMHAIQDRAMVVNGRIEVRPMMYLALSYDHRLVDGKEAVTFLVSVKEAIENPGMELLGL